MEKVAFPEAFLRRWVKTNNPELTDEQLASVVVTLKVGGAKKTLVAGEDYKVVGYTNNVKKGSMTVTIEGTGEETERGTFSGTKTFKVKIVAKNLDAKSD